MKKPTLEEMTNAVTKALDADACKDHLPPNGQPWIAARGFIFNCDKCRKNFAKAVLDQISH